MSALVVTIARQRILSTNSFKVLGAQKKGITLRHDFAPRRFPMNLPEENELWR